MVQQGLELTTRRFVLRPITRADASPLHDLWASPGVRRFLWDDEAIAIERTQEAIEQSQRLFREYQYGLWGAWSIDGLTLDGFAGMWPFREPAAVELLFGVAERLWGNGCATEMAEAVIAYCFDSLAMSVVRASTDAANMASTRVLEKLGFDFVHRSTVGGLDTVFYELARRAI
jgi:RimJ/RimL family protein N-acetyltransferase